MGYWIEEYKDGTILLMEGGKPKDAVIAENSAIKKIEAYKKFIDLGAKTFLIAPESKTIPDLDGLVGRVSVSEVWNKRLTWIPWAEDFRPRIPTQWTYPQQYPEGAIVHFTAGASIESSLSYLAEKGYPCLGIGRDGQVHQAHPLDKGGPHSGTSHHRKFVGIEVASAGPVKQDTNGSYLTYWGKPLSPDLIRVSGKDDNIQPGNYEKFTKAQEESLEELILWLKANNPDVFSLDNVLGHDEVAPQNKCDPGGALSMSMPKYREHIKKRFREVYGQG